MKYLITIITTLSAFSFVGSRPIRSVDHSSVGAVYCTVLKSNDHKSTHVPTVMTNQDTNLLVSNSIAMDGKVVSWPTHF